MFININGVSSSSFLVKQLNGMKHNETIVIGYNRYPCDSIVITYNELDNVYSLNKLVDDRDELSVKLSGDIFMVLDKIYGIMAYYMNYGKFNQFTVYKNLFIDNKFSLMDLSDIGIKIWDIISNRYHDNNDIVIYNKNNGKIDKVDYKNFNVTNMMKENKNIITFIDKNTVYTKETIGIVIFEDDTNKYFGKVSTLFRIKGIEPLKYDIK